MQPEVNRPTIAADDSGIHFLRGEQDIIVYWGEVAQVCALRENGPDGAPVIEIFVDHFSGVDFRFYSSDAGYQQTTVEMEKQLVGFDRATLETVGTFDEMGETIPAVWKRDEAMQPFQLRPPVIDPLDPTPKEFAQIKVARQAAIATCEKILRRSLEPSELACVYTGFENGRIVGRIASPLCHLLTERQSNK